MTSQSEIVLVMSPFGYPYAIPYQLGYLKSALVGVGLSAKCLDLNIEMYHQFDLLEEVQNTEKMFQKYQDKNKLLNVNNWSEPQPFDSNLKVLLQDYILSCAEKILMFGPKLIGFSVFNTNFTFVVELIQKIRVRDKDVFIALGGPDCTICHHKKNTFMYDELFSKNLINAVIVGEGELTLPDLCQAVLEGRDYRKIPGVASRSLLGKSKLSVPRVHIEDISTIAFPDYSDFELDKYVRNVLPLSFNRGCNFHCTFCEIESLWQNVLRVRSAQNIFEEMCYLAKFSSRDYIFFHGAYVNTDQKLLIELTELLIGHWGDSPRFKWMGYARINKVLNLPLLKQLKKAGCYELVFGLESGSQKIANDMKKGFRVELAEEVIKNTAEAGIDVTVFIIVGYPTETEEDFEQTLQFLARNCEYIKAAYCMSECILSQKMRLEPTKYGIRPEKRINSFTWTGINGLTYADRQERLQRFYRHIEALGIKHS